MRAVASGGILAILLLVALLPTGTRAAPICLDAEAPDECYAPEGVPTRGNATACVPSWTTSCSEDHPLLRAWIEWEAGTDPPPSSVRVSSRVCAAVPYPATMQGPFEGPAGLWDPSALRLCVRDGTVYFNDCVPLMLARDALP